MKRFLSSEDGATAIEYALIMATIFLVIVVGVVLLGKKTESHYNYVANEVTNANQ